MTETSEAGASSSNETHPAGSAYDVFVSFRGKDTRYGITDVLYHFMKDKGIHVFRDTEEIRHGEEIGDELSRAIPDSRIYVVVFSKDYASSGWCLRELAMMVDCCWDMASGKLIFPIFYDVSPSDVKLHTNLYRSALDKHREKYKEEDVKKWEDALKKAGGISGMEYKPHTGLGEFVGNVVADILNKLKTRDRTLPVHLIGMDDRVKTVMDMLNCDTPDKRVVMLCGMGGIGKTTLAKVIFNKISTEFNGCSFLADVRESLSTGVGGVEMLQNKLLKDIFGKSDGEIGDSGDGMNEIQRRLRNRKVLIVFDDVSERTQLKTLIGNFHFFGPGTRIIITTRDRSVCKGLMRCNDVFTYEMEGMRDDHALQLFNWHAFGPGRPQDDFGTLSKQVIRMTGNLPLALEVMGGHLFNESKDVWLDIVKKLERVPDEGVMKILRLSYDSLGEREKQIFLDIACFTEDEMPREYASYMWEACGFHPKSGLDILQNRSLMKVLNVDSDVEYNFWRHSDELWLDYIIGDMGRKRDKYRMHDLIREMGREIVRSECPLHCLGMRSRLWDWKEARNVVHQKQGTHHVLAMSLGWEEDRFTGEEFEGMSNLRFLSLQGGEQFIGEFRNFPTKLLWLRWDFCRSVPNPGFFKMDNLVILQISGSGFTDKSMKDLRMGNLRVLHIRDTIITRMPDLSHCSKLEIIILKHCYELEELHSSVGVLGDLKSLKIEECLNLTKLPEEIGSAEALQELILDGCNCIQELPESIGSLKNLRILRGNGTNTRKLPSWIGNLKSLEVLEIESGYSFSIPGLQIPSEVPKLQRCNLSGLSRLLSLSLSGLDELGELQELPSSLTKLSFRYCPLQLFPNISSLTNLTELVLALRSETNKGACVHLPGIEKLHRLQKLILNVPGKSLLLSTELFSLSRLEVNSEDISSISQLPSSLHELSLKGLETEVQWVRYSNLQSLHKLELYGSGLREIRLGGLDNLGNMSYLRIVSCENLRKLSDLACLRRLCSLYLTYCPRLIGIPGVERMELLEELIIEGCNDLLRIPDLRDLRRLKVVDLASCQSLQSVPDMVGECHISVHDCGKFALFEGPYRLYRHKRRREWVV